jgi:hypothetical protein
VTSRWLVFHVEIETDTDDPAAIAAIIDHIDSQVSGLPQMIKADCADGIDTVAYQAVSMHGQERDD